MASGLASAGTDLDSIFAPQQSGWANASATGYSTAGSDLNARYAPIARGVAARVTGFEIAGGADLNTVFAALGTTNVIVSQQPGNVSGAAAAGNPSGTVTSNTTSCAGARGGPALTYTWHCASGYFSGLAFTGQGSQTTGVTGPVPAGQTLSGTMYCTISDGVTSVNTNTVSWSLQNTSAAFSGATYTYTTGSGAQTIPGGANTVRVKVWGAGGGGGGAGELSGQWYGGAGGGAGGYVEHYVSCAGYGGYSIDYTVGTGGPGGSPGVGEGSGKDGTAGTASQVSAGSFPIATLTANGGGGGHGPGDDDTIVGAGGTASGGNVADTTGGSGAPSSAGEPGGAGGSGGGSAGGAGGSESSGVAGGNGQVQFIFEP